MTPESMTPLILEYLAYLGEENEAEDPEEWKIELEEKFNAIHNACWEMLGYPSLAEIHAMTAPHDEIISMIKHYNTNAGKLTSELIFGISSVMAQHLDVSIDKKVGLLAAIATQKENVPLHMELKAKTNPG